jgi:hypothetical protein
MADSYAVMAGGYGVYSNQSGTNACLACGAARKQTV